MRIAALDIGGTSIKSAWVVDGTLQDLREQPTDARQGGPHVVERAMAILEQYRATLPPGQKIDRIGISTAGQVDFETGSIRYANENILNYTGTPLRDLFQKRFNVPVVVENDVNAAAAGEAYCGAGTLSPNGDFLCLTYGTGVGGAIVFGGKLYRGIGFSAGEFGGMVLHADQRNPKDSLFSGCYEQYASTTALVRLAMTLDPALNDGRKIFTRLDEEPVREIVDRWILEIVYGLSSLVHIFDPPLLVLGGGIMNEDYVIENIRRLLLQHTMPSYHILQVEQAKLGNRAGLIGAAHLAELL